MTRIGEACHTNDLSDKSYLYELHLFRRAKKPNDLVGDTRRLTDVRAAMATGRLVVLGEPGAGDDDGQGRAGCLAGRD